MLTVFVRRVSSHAPAASDVLCELGCLLSLQDMYKDAYKCYSTALKTDPKCTSALVGTVSSHPGSNIIFSAMQCPGHISPQNQQKKIYILITKKFNLYKGIFLALFYY